MSPDSGEVSFKAREFSPDTKRIIIPKIARCSEPCSSEQMSRIQASTAKMTKTSEATLQGQGMLIIRKAGRII